VGKFGGALKMGCKIIMVLNANVIMARASVGGI